MDGVTSRGLDPRTSLVRFGLPAIAAGVVIGGTLPGVVAGVLAASPTSLPWLFERLFAWLAYLTMSLSVVYGLLLSTKLLDAIAHRPVSFALHQDLAVAGLAMAALHAGLLSLDASMPFTLTDLLLPGASPYAPLAVGAGQVALYLTAIVTASFHVRRRIGQRAWRALHLVTFLSFAGATAHGIAAGTDSGQAWAQWIYLGSLAIVAFLVAYRLGLVLAARAGRRARLAPAA